MKLYLFSDVHFHHSDWDFRDFDPDGLYLNAGDSDFLFVKYAEGLVRDAGSSMITAHGNHDYYGARFPLPGDNQTLIVWKGLRIAACTMWTDVDSDAGVWHEYTQQLADSRWIHGLYRHEYQAVRKADEEFLLDSKPDVVVTHCSPSMRGCDPRWGDTLVNRAFHSHDDRLLREIQPRLWVHGHTHDPCDYVEGRTRVVCHPRGYPGERNHAGYVPKEIEL